MKIACTPISLSKTLRDGDMDAEGYINFCGEMELDGVDLLDSRCYPWLWKNTKEEFPKVSQWLEKAGVKLAAYACGNNFAKLDADEWQENVDIVVNAIEEAAEVGAPALRIFGGYHEDCGGKPGVTQSTGFPKIIEGIEACLPIAEKYQVVLALENHGRLPGHSWEIKALLDHFNSPYLKSMFDCANFLASNMDETEDPLVAYETLKDGIIHTHVKDWGKPVTNLDRRVEGYIAGDGGLVPLRQFAALLEKDGYEGYCSLEYEAAHMSPEMEGVPKSLEYLKEIRAALNVLKP